MDIVSLLEIKLSLLLITAVTYTDIFPEKYTFCKLGVCTLSYKCFGAWQSNMLFLPILVSDFCINIPSPFLHILPFTASLTAKSCSE